MTHHPLQTLELIVGMLSRHGNQLLPEHRLMIQRQLSGSLTQAEKRLGVVPEGYQRQTATASLTASKTVFIALEAT